MGYHLPSTLFCKFQHCTSNLVVEEGGMGTFLLVQEEEWVSSCTFFVSTTRRMSALLEEGNWAYFHFSKQKDWIPFCYSKKKKMAYPLTKSQWRLESLRFAFVLQNVTVHFALLFPVPSVLHGIQLSFSQIHQLWLSLLPWQTSSPIRHLKHEL